MKFRIIDVAGSTIIEEDEELSVKFKINDALRSNKFVKFKNDRDKDIYLNPNLIVRFFIEDEDLWGVKK